MKKKILVTGSSGLVGSRFVELYSSKYILFTPQYPEFDLTNKESLERVFDKNFPDVVINFAAYTNVGEAENQRNDKNGDCWKINVEGTKNLVCLIDPDKTHLIHISTDYVFPGSKERPGPYSEDAKPETDSDKLTWYGFTKAEGERVVSKYLNAKNTILRLIYPVRAKYAAKLDYLRKPLSLFDQGKLYPMFIDQQVSITFIDEACLVLEKIINGKIYGIFHASTPDTSTPFDLVSYLLEKARNAKNAVKKSSLSEFLKKINCSEVRYPRFGGLKVEYSQKTLGIKFSSWKEVIDILISQGISS